MTPGPSCAKLILNFFLKPVLAHANHTRPWVKSSAVPHFSFPKKSHLRPKLCHLLEMYPSQVNWTQISGFLVHSEVLDWDLVIDNLLRKCQILDKGVLKWMAASLWRFYSCFTGEVDGPSTFLNRGQKVCIQLCLWPLKQLK